MKKIPSAARVKKPLPRLSISGFHIYKYLFKTNRPDMPFATYGDR